MGDDDNDDQTSYDGEWMLDEITADTESNIPSTSKPSMIHNSIEAKSSTGYLSAARACIDVMKLKKQYVDNMKRLIRTCRRETAKHCEEKEEALRRLRTREASRLQPCKAVANDDTLSLTLTFRSTKEVITWASIHRMNVHGLPQLGHSVERSKNASTQTHDQSITNGITTMNKTTANDTSKEEYNKKCDYTCNEKLNEEAEKIIHERDRRRYYRDGKRRRDENDERIDKRRRSNERGIDRKDVLCRRLQEIEREKKRLKGGSINKRL